MSQVLPPRWSEDDFTMQSTKAMEKFKEERIGEPLEIYSDFFDQYRDSVENLLEESVDLERLSEVAHDYIVNKELRFALRYLASPAVSDDDLRVLADTTFSRTALSVDPNAAHRVVEAIMAGLDRWRFPWVTEHREPTGEERQVATISTTALIAASRAQTYRRTVSKEEQENLVAETLLQNGLKEVPTRVINNLRQAPKAGEFCRESDFGGRKADIVVGLWDGRILPCECKVSNSAANSVKRLNNDAAVKATAWIREFGERGVVPTAVLSGVFKVHNLMEAQRAHLTIFWAHELDTMLDFIESTRP